MPERSAQRRSFLLYLIKPSHYDDEGYVIQWMRSAIPSDTLAALSGLAMDCCERRVLGDDADIKIIQRELPLDLLEFFCLTPLPGSEDHKRLLLSGVPMDPDMNKYDLEHVCTAHPVMSKTEWERAYRLAWETYYTPEHMEIVMRRAAATGISPGKMMFLLMWFAGCVMVEKLHPLEGGYLRRRVRTDRRPGLPLRPALLFYPAYGFELAAKHVRIARMVWRMARMRKNIKRDPRARDYTDTALTPVTDDEVDALEMFQVSNAARAAAEKTRRADGSQGRSHSPLTPRREPA